MDDFGRRAPAGAPRTQGQWSDRLQSDASVQARLGSLFAPVGPQAPRTAAPLATGALDTAPTGLESRTVSASAQPALAIGDLSKVETRLQVEDELSLTNGSLSVDIPHTYQGDLRVTLTSPSGRSVVLHDRKGGGADDLKATFNLGAFAGESTRGEWKLTVEDLARADVGTLASWGLELTGTAPAEELPPEETEPEPTPDPFQGLRDEALLRAVQASSSGKRVLSYDNARKAIFGDLDVVNGKVRDVYTGREINGGRVPNSSDMNVEHTWPQSKGAKGVAKSDLHHLFPTDSKANSRRSSYPFGKVVDVTWSQGGSKLGKDAAGRTVFEPPDEHKGNVARAMFYFSATYGKSIPDFEEAALKEWNQLDAVDGAELARNRRIAELQGNVNQFVEHASLADRIADF